MTRHGTPILRAEATPAPDWGLTMLWISDVHWDHPGCDRSLLKKHLNRALEIGALIFVAGDFFDAMQGRNDKRRGRDGVRPEHNVPAYYQSLIETAGRWLLPYAHRIAMISPGNHETSVLKYADVDLTAGLVDWLNLHREDGSPATMLGRYAGYIPLKLRINNSRRGTRWAMFYSHGHGGGGEVTKGVIQAQRRAVYVSDAQVILSGHIHESWSVDIRQHRLKDSGREYTVEGTHVSIPGYLRGDYEPGRLEGHHIERGRPPKPVGGWWLRLWLELDREHSHQIHHELTRAR